MQFNERKIKSRRVKRVVNKLLNKDPDDKDCGEKKRKTNLNRRKRKKPQLSKIQNMSSEDESCDRVQKQSTPGLVSKDYDSVIKATAHTNNQPLSNVQKDSGNNTSTDSTSDTSDDDKNYVPFKKVTVQHRGRAGLRDATRGSRSRAKKTSTTRTKT